MEPKTPKLSQWMTYDKLIPYIEPGDLIEIRRVNFYIKTIQHWVVAVECVPEDCFVVGLTDDSIAHRDRISDITYGKDCRINNLEDNQNPPLPPGEIVQRAIGSIGESKIPYNFTEYNCEHFATKCRNDVAISHQVEKAGVLLQTGNLYRKALNFLSCLDGFRTGEAPKSHF